MCHEQLRFKCGGIDDEGRFLPECTGYGQNASPAFIIENLAPDAKTLAVTLEDLSHPIRDFTHWIIWNIPAAERIPGGLPAGKRISGPVQALQGRAYGWHRYAGPKPPKGADHLYRFTLYALDCELDLPAGVFKKRFLKKAAGHILQKGEVTGAFGGR